MVVGDERQPVNEKDAEGMAYLQAYVKELLRKHPPTYFSLTHAAVRPGKLDEYDVPPEANLEIYLPAISADPRLWSRPKEFDSKRFLTRGDSADIKRVKEIRMVPFEAGRRVCPGMVQAFEWLSEPEKPKVNFGNKLEFTVMMSLPLQASVTHRK